MKYPLEELTEALKYYHQKTKRRFTIEYILFHDFNDSILDARELAIFCKSFPVKINLIEYNSTHNSEFRKSQKARVIAFKDFLETKNLIVNTRKSRGEDITAACGQLALKEKLL
jgi:23S rRNA (adenine2503-C2)-methyltransferase